MAVEGNYKVKITVGDATVEIEGQKEGVVEIVSALSKILEPRGAKVPPGATTHAVTESSATFPPAGRLVDIRSFFAQKKPNTHIEATTVAAFYIQHLAPMDQRGETISAGTLQRLFMQAGWRLPKVISQVLVDTKRAGYLDATSQAGEYRLNPVGYNLVAHTLSGESPPNLSKHGKKAKRLLKKV